MKDKAREDYLRAMYRIYEGQEDNSTGIRAVEIAKFLGVSKPSVSAMVSKLSAEGLVKAKPYSSIFLTPKGLTEAKRITKKYRIIEVFLAKVLGYSDNKIQDEAHRLEHAFSDASVKRISRLLDYPENCPHGKHIPEVIEADSTLASVKVGKKVTIKDIDSCPHLKKRLLGHAVYEGAEVEVVKNDSTGPLILKVLDSKVCIGRGQAHKIMVKYHGKKTHARAGRKPKRR